MKKTLLSDANELLRGGKYSEAIIIYEMLLNKSPTLKGILEFNMAQAKKRKEKQGQLFHRNGDKVAVVAHYYYPDVWQDIANLLKDINYPNQLFVTAPDEIIIQATKDVHKHFPDAIIYGGPNLGMDIVPFINVIPEVHKLGFEIVCKLQTKRGVDELASIWRDVMLQTLIGSNHNFEIAIEAFKKDPTLSMIGPASLYQSGPRLMLNNKQHLEALTKILLKSELPDTDWGFFAGTMFWVKTATLLDLAKIINFKHPALTKEYQQDGKIEHALERMFGLIAKINESKIGLLNPTTTGFKKCKISTHNPGEHVNAMGVGQQLRQISRYQFDSDIVKKSKLFDEDIYLDSFPKIREIGADPLFHYFTHGHHKGVLPTKNKVELQKICDHLRISGDTRHPMLVYAEGGDFIRNLINLGENKILGKALKYNKDMIARSELFDEDFYVSQLQTKPPPRRIFSSISWR